MNAISEFITDFQSSSELLNYSLDHLGLFGFSVCVFLFGEIMIIFGLPFLLHINFSLPEIIVAAIFGTIAADIFWFSLSRYFPQRTLPGWIQVKLLSPVDSALKHLIKDRIFLSLIFLKFLIGIRLISIIFIARQKITFAKFLLFDLFGTSIYIFLLTALIIFLNKITTLALPAFQALSNILSGLIILLIASIITKNALGARTKAKPL